MKKLFLSLSIFAVSAAYVAYQYVGGTPTSTAALTPASGQNQLSAAPVTTTPAVQTTPAPITTPIATQPQPAKKPAATVPTPAPSPVPAPVVKPKGQYADGTYTGSVADAYYGMVQVRALIQGGKLTDVTFLQYPNDRRTSQYINSQAMPLLTSEAIQAQSADVSGVSGATDTSQAFIQSLADALAKAKNA